MVWFPWLKKVKTLFQKESMPSYEPLHVVQLQHGSYDQWKTKYLASSLIVLIMGKRGSGKTALGMTLLELMHEKTKRPCFVWGYEKTKLPRWMKKTTSLEELPENAVLLLDEGAVAFSSRDAMQKGNKYLSNLMVLARHKNISLLMVTQNSAMIELNVLRLADTLFFKEPSLLQTQFERRAIKQLYENVLPVFENNKKQNHSLHLYAYLLDDDCHALLHCALPTFWNLSMSKAHKGWKS